jgi:hypothetical protein
VTSKNESDGRFVDLWCVAVSERVNDLRCSLDSRKSVGMAREHKRRYLYCNEKTDVGESEGGGGKEWEQKGEVKAA